MEYRNHLQISATSGRPLNYSFSSSNLPDLVQRSRTEVDLTSQGAGLLAQPTNRLMAIQRSGTMLPWRPATYFAQPRTASFCGASEIATGPVTNASSLAIRQVDQLRTPEIFSAARNALATRYTPSSWMEANRTKLHDSDRARQMSEVLRADCQLSRHYTDEMTRRSQEESSKRLHQRITDVSYVKNELLAETDRLIREMNCLLEAKQAAEKALAETENPLFIAQECLYNREKRQGIDLVHDQCEIALLSEVDVIKQCQAELRTVIEKACAQLSLDRSVQHLLEVDSRDKFIAQQLDETAHAMNNNSHNISLYNDVEKVDNSTSVPDSWAEFSAKNIKRSMTERSASRECRVEIERQIMNCMQRIRDAWQRSCSELGRRSQETADARCGLQTSLNLVLQELYEMEQSMDHLRKCIADKEAPLKVAQSRLEARLKRPNVEACRDPAYNKLIAEVQELTDAVNQLMAKLNQATDVHQHLLKTRATLEQDLAIKCNSLNIDREQCLGIRRAFPMSADVFVN